MATKPTYKPTWAQNDTTLPNAGTDNKLRPTSDLRDVGIDYGQQLTAQEFNWIVNNIREWIDYLEADSGVQDAAVADNNDGDAVEATLGVDSYNSEDVYWIEWPANNTSTTPTLNVNGNGAATVISLDGDALEADDLIGGRLYPFWYDGSNFVVCSVLKASQADAEGGTDDKQYMTALRVHQAFSQYGLGTISLPYIDDFNNAYQLETGFYHWDDNTVGEPSGGSLVSGQPTVLITNENGLANLLAFMNGVLYTATCTSSNLSSWHTYSQTLGQVIDTQTFTDPTGNPHTWTKPWNANPDDTVVARIWAGGGSGSTSENTSSTFEKGGEGGGFVEVSVRASALGSSEPIEIGSGGAGPENVQDGATAGNPGDNSSAFGFIAQGGRGGLTDTTGYTDGAGFSDDATSRVYRNPIWLGGSGGDDSTYTGQDALYGGAGGGSVNGSAGAGGVSRYGGNGGAADRGAGATAENGQQPGGGGGAALIPGNDVSPVPGGGGDGQVIVYVIRGWSPSGITTEI